MGGIGGMGMNMGGGGMGMQGGGLGGRNQMPGGMGAGNMGQMGMGMGGNGMMGNAVSGGMMGNGMSGGMMGMGMQGNMGRMGMGMGGMGNQMPGMGMGPGFGGAMGAGAGAGLNGMGAGARAGAGGGMVGMNAPGSPRLPGQGNMGNASMHGMGNASMSGGMSPRMNFDANSQGSMNMGSLVDAMKLLGIQGANNNLRPNLNQMSQSSMNPMSQTTTSQIPSGYVVCEVRESCGTRHRTCPGRTLDFLCPWLPCACGLPPRTCAHQHVRANKITHTHASESNAGLSKDASWGRPANVHAGRASTRP